MKTVRVVPLCPRCQQRMTAYQHDPSRWWICTPCGTTERREASTQSCGTEGS